MKPIKPWTYGTSPAPCNWQEAADALKTIRQPKAKGSGLLDRLAAIETLLKEKK